MIKVEIDGLDRLKAAMSGAGKQVVFAAAVALTRTARAIKEAVPARMEQELDRPTPFSKGGLYVKAARRESLTAEVGFMTRQAAYMKYQIAGGARSGGARGIKLPGNIELNTFGNIPKGTIDKLKAAAQNGTLSSVLARRLGAGNRRKGAAPIQLFFGKPTGRGWEKAPMGIWRRIPGTPGKLVPVIMFEDTPARYQPKFKFGRLGEEVVRREWDRQFSTALDQAMRTSR